MSGNTAPQSAPSKPLPTANTKPNRLPAPTLFVGPPSRNESQLSISRTATHDLLSRGKSSLARPNFTDGESATGGGGDGDGPKDHDHNNPTIATTLPPPPLKKAGERNVEAKWQEMQSTLNEVELTAQSSTHVFGERHAAALEELRRAQIELARAWGYGGESRPGAVHSGDGEPTTTTTPESALALDQSRLKAAEELGQERSQITSAGPAGQASAAAAAMAGKGTGTGGRKRGDTATSTASTALSDESVRSDFTSRSGGRSQLEEETAQDIQLASERRAANEAYFKKVDSGVRDVVAKLEAVAEAMRGVEAESRSLWSSSSATSP